MYEIWDKTEGFNLADGTPCTVAEINARYPFTTGGTIIIEKLANGNVGSIDSLDIVKEIFPIDSALGDTDALAAIETARKAAETAAATAAAEAAALPDKVTALHDQLEATQSVLDALLMGNITI